MADPVTFPIFTFGQCLSRDCNMGICTKYTPRGDDCDDRWPTNYPRCQHCDCAEAAHRVLSIEYFDGRVDMTTVPHIHVESRVHGRKKDETSQTEVRFLSPSQTTCSSVSTQKFCYYTPCDGFHIQKAGGVKRARAGTPRVCTCLLEDDHESRLTEQCSSSQEP